MARPRWSCCRPHLRRRVRGGRGDRALRGRPRGGVRDHVYALYTYLVREGDPFHISLLVGIAVVLAAAVWMAAAGVPMAWCLLIVMLAPAVTVVGYQTLGYRHMAAALNRTLAGLRRAVDPVAFACRESRCTERHRRRVDRAERSGAGCCRRPTHRRFRMRPRRRVAKIAEPGCRARLTVSGPNPLLSDHRPPAKRRQLSRYVRPDLCDLQLAAGRVPGPARCAHRRRDAGRRAAGRTLAPPQGAPVLCGCALVARPARAGAAGGDLRAAGGPEGPIRSPCRILTRQTPPDPEIEEIARSTTRHKWPDGS